MGTTLIKLTAAADGAPVYVRPDAIQGIAANVHGLDDAPGYMSRATVFLAATGQVVRETPDAIAAMVENAVTSPDSP